MEGEKCRRTAAARLRRPATQLIIHVDVSGISIVYKRVAPFASVFRSRLLRVHFGRGVAIFGSLNLKGREVPADFGEEFKFVVF